MAFLATALIVLLRRTSLRIDGRGARFMAAYGILGFALFEVLFFLTMARTTVAIAVALLYTAPAFVVLLSRVLYGERIGARNGVALFLVLIGVVLVTGALQALVAGEAPIGVSVAALGLASGLVYGLYTLFSKSAVSRYDDPLFSLFWKFAFAAVALTVLAPPLPAAVRVPAALPALIGLGIVPTLLPYLIFLQGLRVLRASTAAMLASVEPVVATLLAAVTLGELPDALRWAGVGCITAAAALLTMQRTEPQET